MDANSGPMLVKPAVPEQDIPERARASDPEQTTLSIPIPENVLSGVSENATELQIQLNKFVPSLRRL